MSYVPYVPIGTELSINTNLPRDRRNGFSKSNSNSTSKSKRNGTTRFSLPNDPDSLPIIVHCHLCWDWVWQRPQQFLSRLARKRKVLFVETIGPDPQLASPLARFHSPNGFSNITVLRLQFPTWRWNDPEYVDQTRRRLVQEFIQGPAAGQFDHSIQWFYDPMAADAFVGQMNEVLTVYDCMDELSKFRCAPPEIKLREAILLAAADVVFTGGRKLWESKRVANSSCHFYGCGVDVHHFAKARLPETEVPAALAKLAHPVLGYFGVVDERMDYELVAKLADANPNWSVAMVGPVLKVDEKSLPQRPNLHWLGKQEYADLPAICKGFDVCLMPFALNESTEFINPTKALEYMASGRQIVSSAVPDVVTNFSSVVKVGQSHDEFIDLCHSAIEQPDYAAVERGLQMAAANTWDSIVAQLEHHMKAALLKKRTTKTFA